MTYFPLYQTTCFFIPLVAPCKPLLNFNYTINAAISLEIFAFTGNNIITLHAPLNLSAFIFHLPPE